MISLDDLVVQLIDELDYEDLLGLIESLEQTVADRDFLEKLFLQTAKAYQGERDDFTIVRCESCTRNCKYRDFNDGTEGGHPRGCPRIREKLEIELAENNASWEDALSLARQALASVPLGERTKEFIAFYKLVVEKVEG